MSNVRFSTLQLSPSHCSKLFVGISLIFRMDSLRPSPTRRTRDETAARRACVMPEPEMRYVPLGTRHIPPPVSASDFKAALNGAVSFVTPSPTAPYVLTLT